MAFILKCLATEDAKDPIRQRCKNPPDSNNGLLCKKHNAMAKQKPIFILMHHQVSKVFKIPFKNQVCVKIDLRENKIEEKPESKTAIDDKKRDIKNTLLQDFQIFGIDKLKEFHDKLKLNIWNNLKSGKNEYAFKYFISKALIDELEKVSIAV